MINTKIKLQYKYFLFLLLGIFCITGLILIVGSVYLLTDRAGQCISEEHGVWDAEQKICRHDCLKWNKEDGCVPLEKE